METTYVTELQVIISPIGGSFRVTDEFSLATLLYNVQVALITFWTVESAARILMLTVGKKDKFIYRKINFSRFTIFHY